MDVGSRSKLPIYRNVGAVNIDSIASGSEPIKDDPQDEPALFLTGAVNDATLKIKRHCTGSSPMLLLKEILNFGQRDQASHCG